LREELHEDEVQAMERWKAKEKEMDDLIDEINGSLDVLNAQLISAGQKIDQNAEMIEEVKAKAVKLDDKFTSTNKRLKDTIKRFRAPSKLCMDACLVILIIVLIGILVRQVIQLTK
jgi:hypothetical protein